MSHRHSETHKKREEPSGRGTSTGSPNAARAPSAAEGHRHSKTHKKREEPSGRGTSPRSSNAAHVPSAAEVQELISNLAQQSGSDYDLKKFKSDFKSALARPPTLAEVNSFLKAKPKKADSDSDTSYSDSDTSGSDSDTSGGVSFYCDECRESIGAGDPRWMCVECPRTDFCSSCHGKFIFNCGKPHFASHRLIELRNSEASFMFSDIALAAMAGTSCDECGEIICNKKGSAYHGMYHCTVCDNFDLCFDCVRKSKLQRCPKHSFSHPMMFLHNKY